MFTTPLRPAIVGLTSVIFWSLSLGLPTTSGQDLSWAEKMFEKQKHDFGVVARASNISYRFKVTNIYEEQVHIAKAETTCGCTSTKPSADTLNCRDVAYIEVTMDTRRFTRRKDSTLIVTFDAPYYAQVRIPITVYIRTDVVLEPGVANFGAVDHGKPADQKLSIAYAGRDDWCIKEVLTKSEHLTAQVTETARGNGQVNYELTVHLEPTAPPGAFRRYITLVTDDQKSPHFPVLIEARIEADITVTPDVVALGTLVPGQEKSFNVVLRGKKPFEITKVECESNTDAFTVRLPKTGLIRPVHVLPLTVNAPNKPGAFSEVFVVTIPGQPEPVTFKARGHIAEPATL